MEQSIDFTKFGKKLNPKNIQENFLINELKQMNSVCQEDKLLSSFISKDLNVPIQVIYEGDKHAPEYNDSKGSIVYHTEIVENQIENKGKNNIYYATQSSIFHELVHAEQVKTGLQPARTHIKNGEPFFVIDNAYDTMGIEAECKMLNAMYHIKAWEKEGKNLDEMKALILQLQENGAEIVTGKGQGVVLPEYIDIMQQAKSQGKTNDEAHLIAGKQIILSLMSGNYSEWKNMYFGQISYLENKQTTAGFSQPKLQPSSQLLDRLQQKYGISKNELASCNMTRQLLENRNQNNPHSKMLELSGRKTPTTNQPQPTSVPQKINNNLYFKALENNFNR